VGTLLLTTEGGPVNITQKKKVGEKRTLGRIKEGKGKGRHKGLYEIKKAISNPSGWEVTWIEKKKLYGEKG